MSVSSTGPCGWPLVAAARASSRIAGAGDQRLAAAHHVLGEQPVALAAEPARERGDLVVGVDGVEQLGRGARAVRSDQRGLVALAPWPRRQPCRPPARRSS